MANPGTSVYDATLPVQWFQLLAICVYRGTIIISNSDARHYKIRFLYVIWPQMSQFHIAGNCKAGMFRVIVILW